MDAEARNYKCTFVTNFSWIGVSLFFVISGFIISERIDVERSFGAFLFKRYMRVLPLYGLFTLLAIALSLGLDEDFFAAAEASENSE